MTGRNVRPLSGKRHHPDQRPAKRGPWAGKILTGDEGEGLSYAVDASGTVTNFSLGINTEDFDLIPTNQDLYCADNGAGTIVKIPRTLLAPYVGRLLITEAGEYGRRPCSL